MLHLFADPADMQDGLLTITGSEVNHIRNVLRMKPGDELDVSNGTDAKEYRYGIEMMDAEKIVCRLRFVKDSDVELPVKVYLFQGIPKSDKMDLIVQKCVELGVFSVIPVSMERCVAKIWQKIAEAAAMQSKRRVIPKVAPPMTMKEAVAFARDNTDVRILPYELMKEDGSTKALLESIRPGSSVSVFIGPEGGFTTEEVAEAKEAGILPVSLGRRILRTETAGMTVLSWLIYILEIS